MRRPLLYERRGGAGGDGVIVPGDVVKQNRHKKVLNHNYLPPLAWGTPSFIKKETAGKPAGNKNRASPGFFYFTSAC